MSSDHEEEKQRQKSISLKFQTKNLWRDLQHVLGVEQAGAAIILDICMASGWVSYSRTASHYDLARRYRNPLYTWRKVVSAVDCLAASELIHHDRRLPGWRGWQSAIQATDELRRIVMDTIGGRPLVLAKPAEVILLRDKQRKLMDYRDTRQLDRMRRKIEQFNEALMGGDLDPAITAPLTRIFNIGFGRGGRFYAMGTSWQNIKSEARKSLTIGGERVVELDFKNLHPAILYAEAGARIPRDCYELTGWSRELVKVAMLTLINAPTKQKARLSIAHSEHMAQVAELGSQEAMRAAETLIDDIKRMHRPIADSFHSDAGARLMSIDATMAEMVMSIMLRKGIVVLPVHDSFLVQASKGDDLEAAMMEAAYRAGFEALRVEMK